MLLAAALSVAGPPTVEPTPEPGEAIGIAWHDQATVAPKIQQRLAAQLGDAVIVVDAPGLTRARVALELPRERVAKASRWTDALAEATAAYRAGEIDRAQQGVVSLLEAVRSDPVVPGATRLAWRALVLQAQLAWAESDVEATETALAAAIALDPQARPSTREVPPPVVEAYARQRATVIAGVGQWPRLEIRAAEPEPFGIEIDGVPGRRPVPPGEHFVVIRRPGHAPVGTVLHSDQAWSPSPTEVVIAAGLPVDVAAAQRICDRGQLQWLVLARLRDDRLGLQRYTCGEGFSAAWYEADDGWEPGVAMLESEPEQGWTAAAVLHRPEPWPVLPPSASAVPRPWIATDGGGPTTGRDRLRRALPWLIIGGLVAGGVTLGVMLGNDPRPDLAIDGNGFLGR